jgi:bifunctional non-homologous end joining protein LigD
LAWAPERRRGTMVAMNPMLATAGVPPRGSDWLFEVKWDGMRVLADTADRTLRLYSRGGNDVTDNFPELDGIADVAQDALLDGEIIALRGGLPSFAALSERIHIADRRRSTQLVFDLLRLYGVDLTGRPLLERRASLDRLVLPGPRWQSSPVYTDGAGLLAATAEQGLEGIVAKRAASVYRPGRRSPDWIKTAHRHHQVCVVGGWRGEAGDEDNVGALLLGIPDGQQSEPQPRDAQIPDAPRSAGLGSAWLSFAGRVGSGIDRRTQSRLRRELLALVTTMSPFAEELSAPDRARAHWCRPELVVEVTHTGWTTAGRLRHPVWRGIRVDLTPAEVQREP